MQAISLSAMDRPVNFFPSKTGSPNKIYCSLFPVPLASLALPAFQPIHPSGLNAGRPARNNCFRAVLSQMAQ